MEVSGKIKWLDETKTYGNNGFRKREVVVTTEEQYPTYFVEFVQDKCELLNNFQLGQNVKVGINLRGLANGSIHRRDRVFQFYSRMAH